MSQERSHSLKFAIQYPHFIPIPFINATSM